MHKELLEILNRRVLGIKQQLEALKKEKLTLKASHAEIDKKEAELKAQLIRAKQFNPNQDGGPFCPTCYIERGENIVFRPVAANPNYPSIDQFECSKCGLWMEVKP